MKKIYQQQLIPIEEWKNQTSREWILSKDIRLACEYLNKSSEDVLDFQFDWRDHTSDKKLEVCGIEEDDRLVTPGLIKLLTVVFI